MSSPCCAARTCHLCQWWRQRDLYVSLKFFRSVAMAVENAQSLSEEGATPAAVTALRPFRSSIEVEELGATDLGELRRHHLAWLEAMRRREWMRSAR